MVSTEVVNGTDGDLSLKEGNAGVYRDMVILKPTKSFTIEIDPNATYRQYVGVSTPGDTSGDAPGDSPGSTLKVFISSDDCVDNSTITIVKEGGKFAWKGSARTTGPDQGGFMGFLKQIRRVLPGGK